MKNTDMVCSKAEIQYVIWAYQDGQYGPMIRNQEKEKNTTIQNIQNILGKTIILKNKFKIHTLKSINLKIIHLWYKKVKLKLLWY